MKASKNDIELFAQLLDHTEQEGKTFKSQNAYMSFANKMIDCLDATISNFDREKFEWRLFGL